MVVFLQPDTITGIALSGARTLDELMLGRTLLFDKIYRHQKVRAAEAMVASVFLSIADLIASTPVQAPYVLTDDELLGIDEKRVSQLAGRELTDVERQRVTVAVDLVERLKTRRLFVRSFAFAQNMPLDPYCLDSDQRRGLEELLRVTHEPIKR